MVDLFMKLISNVDYEDAYDVKCLLLFMMRMFMLLYIIVELYA